MKPSELGYDSDEYLSFDPIEFAISQDGKSWISNYDVDNLQGVYCYRAPDVQPANPSDTMKKIGLQDGSRLISTTYNSRELKFELIYDGVSETGAMLAWEAAQRFLVARDAYWITFSNWRNRMYYGKAKLAAPTYSNEKCWTCEVTFTDFIGLSRSIGTTLDYPDQVWGVNSNIPEGVEPQYRFNTNTFSVYNLSDVLIDPEWRGHPFKLTLQGKSNGNLTITNKVGGTVYKKSAFDGTFVLDGVNPECNGQGCLLDTNCGVVTLAMGKNDFQIDNFSGTITFEFPMWWLA
ncbi:MAG TPA: phage tail family protein [Enterobacter roggenkampii]|nr:phage tail family protein [Enterobacter roggenkampii]